MKRNLLASALLVLALGFASAQGVTGNYADYPVILNAGDSITATAGNTSFVQIAQDSNAWDLAATDVSDMVYVDDDGYAPSATKILDSNYFWVLNQGAPSGWAVYVAKAEAGLDGKFHNTYAVRVPAGTAAGSYTLNLQVRSNDNGDVFSFPLTVNVAN